MTRISDERIAQIVARRDELSARMASGQLEGEAFVAASRDYAEVERVASVASAVAGLRRELADIAAMIDGGDAELAAMAAEEREGVVARLEAAEHDLAIAMLPRDAADERSAMLEIRAGTGGDEAALFAGDLLRMYAKFS